MKVSVLEIVIFLIVIGLTILFWNTWYHYSWFEPEYNRDGMLISTFFGRMCSIIHGIILLVIILGPMGLLEWMANTEVRLPIKGRYDN